MTVDTLRLSAEEATKLVAELNGKTLVRRETAGRVADAEQLGRALGEELLSAGARDILSLVYGHAG